MNRPEPRKERYFDFERLIVYRLARKVLKQLLPFLVKQGRRSGSTADHLDRALDSIVLNIAEGAGKEAGSKDRARFYRIALGSAKEAGAALDLLSLRDRIPSKDHHSAREILLEIIAILHAMSG
ncbi:MAG: four helix bundle protein [Planctomycetota bacterium]